ncbi:MAG: hypothetical protein ABIP94_16535 [Planctomycetota bacterium]
MNTILRVIVAVLLAAWVAVPSVGSEGGENAGGTGVWVLPRAEFLCSGSGVPCAGLPRSEIALPDFTKNVHLELSSEMGAAVATLVDQISGVSLGLSVVGNKLVLPSVLFQSLAGSGVTQANIVVADVNQMGYQIRLTLNAATGTGLIRVY